VVVMTSNIGSQAIQQISQHGGSEEEMRQAVQENLRAHFLPEFLNRIDETIIFHPLDRTQIARIVDLQLSRLQEQLSQKNWTLVVSDAARRAIAEEGYDPSFGARPLKRLIQQKIQNPLASEILRGELGEGASLLVGYDNGQFTFRYRRPGEAEIRTEPVG
jgi:ATP-dependent Clp protease ATP-binding subunit ClpB